MIFIIMLYPKIELQSFSRSAPPIRGGAGRRGWPKASASACASASARASASASAGIRILIRNPG